MSGGPTAALAAAVAEAIASGRMSAGGPLPNPGLSPTMAPVAAPSRPVMPLGLSLPPGLGQDAGFSSNGRFFVIRAAEQQPASNLGHFVHVVSGPHNGYNAAVASLSKPSEDQKRSTSLDAAGGSSVKDQISRLLQASSGNPVLPGFPEQLEAGLRASQLAGGSTMDAQGLQRLIQSSQDGADNSNVKSRVTSNEPEEIVFLPLETPVWHLESEQKGPSAMMVTQAENVEWMRMIWGRLTEPTPIMEAIAKQQQEEEEERRKADAERARLQESEQQQQQLSMLNHLMQVLGSGSSLPQQQLTGLPPGIKQLLESQAPESQSVYKASSNSSGMNSVLAMLSGPHSRKPPLPQSLAIASANPPASQSQGDKSDVHRELEKAFGRAYGLPSALSPTLSSLGAPPQSGHHRKGSLESLSLFDTGLLSPRVTKPQSAPVQPPAAFGAKPQLDAPHVRASLTPGTTSPGKGPFIVVSADSRIQLTGTGFYLAVASGPHAGFEEALAAMTAAAHNHSPVRKDAEMVHVLSDTQIWHSLDLMHKPMMIVKAESLLTPPSRLEDDSLVSKSTRSDLLLESLKHNPAALLQQQVLSGATKQTAVPADQPAWAGQHGTKTTALPPLSDQLALLGALTSQGPSTSTPVEALAAASGKPESHAVDLPAKTQAKATTDMPPPPPHCAKMATPSNPAGMLRSPPPSQSDAVPASTSLAVPSEASEKPTSSAPEIASGSGLKRRPSNLSLYPNKKAHILGRQQSLSPRTCQVDEAAEEAKGGGGSGSDTQSGEQEKVPSAEVPAEGPEADVAGDEEKGSGASERESQPPADDNSPPLESTCRS